MSGAGEFKGFVETPRKPPGITRLDFQSALYVWIVMIQRAPSIAEAMTVFNCSDSTIVEAAVSDFRLKFVGDAKDNADHIALSGVGT